MPIEKPRAGKRPSVSVHHGIEKHDDYAWLKAANWQEVMRNPAALPEDIRAYLTAENDYAAAEMADTETLQAALYAEMRGRIKEDDSSVPAPDGPYAYAIRYHEGAEHPTLVRSAREGGTEAALLDVNALATGKAYFRLGGAAHSPDHRLLAYAADDKGSEAFTIRVRDLATGNDRAEAIVDTTGGMIWSPGTESLYYTWIDANHRPARIFRHDLAGSEPDTLIFEEPDSGFFLGVGETQSRRFIILDSHDHETSEARVIDTASPGASPHLVAPRKTGERYQLEHHGARFIILTNADGASDYKIVEAPVAAPGRENWRDLVPHREGRLIISHTVYRDHLVRLERENGLPRIVIRELATGDEHAIAFDEEAYALGMIDGYEFDTTILRFTYSSMTTPNRVYDYDMATRRRVLRKEDEIPSGHDPARYVTRRVHAPAADGETVPISLIHRADLDMKRAHPTLLYGYGAYGITIPAAFSATRLSLVDRGWIFAIAHIRGGKDKGERWYRDGRREKKANSFTDFIAAARHLTAQGMTAPDRLVAWGGSAGGLLMGAVANMAPGEFAGIIAEVPFVDVLATMLDKDLPLTPPEWPEWGNPIASEADYRTIAAYSPFDNVQPQDYPAMLVLAGLTDPRVTYWEPAKWVARLRAEKTDDRLLVLRTNMDAGHAGAAGRFDRLKETALAHAFALKVAGGVA